MKIALALVVVLCRCATGFAQTVSFQTTARGIDVAQTVDGGYVLANHGYESSPYVIKSALVKLNANGDTVWTRRHTTSLHHKLNAVTATSDGGCIVVGRVGTTNNSSVLVTRLDVDGNEMWSKTYFGSFGVGHDVLELADSGYMILAAGYPSLGGYTANTFLTRMDANGDVLWIKSYEVPGADVVGPAEFCRTIDGGFAIFGESAYGLNPNSYLLKTGADGNLEWSRVFWNAGMVYSGIQTSAGEFVMVGYHASSSTPTLQAVLIKLDESGSLLWTRTFADGIFGSVLESNGGYVLCGKFFDDACLIKTDTAGNVLWSHAYDAGYIENVVTAKRTTDDGFVIVGGTVTTKTYADGQSSCSQSPVAFSALDTFTFLVEDSLFVEEELTIPVSNLTVDVASGANIEKLCFVGVEPVDVENDQFTVWPNPTNGLVQIECKGCKPTSLLEIYNTAGLKVVEKRLPEDGILQLSSELADGLYLVRSNEVQIWERVLLLR